MKKIFGIFAAILACGCLLTGCNEQTEADDLRLSSDVPSGNADLSEISDDISDNSAESSSESSLEIIPEIPNSSENSSDDVSESNSKSSPENSVSSPEPVSSDEPPASSSEPVAKPVESTGEYDRRAQEQWEIEFADKVFELTNLEREKAGLPKLQKKETLTRIAVVRAWETTVSWSHTRPDGSKFKTLYDAYGLNYGKYGENIAVGQTTPESVVNTWMNSTGHRENILNPDFTYLGVGFYKVSGGSKGGLSYYWAQDFYAEP